MREALVCCLFAAVLLAGCGSTPEPLDYPGEPATGEVQTTESGLQYVVLTEGTGAAPEPGQTVLVHYSGYLLEDGSMFDSSLSDEDPESAQPFAFPLGQGQVIPGWDEGVGLMKVGGKTKFIIPPDLGYGEDGFPGFIPGGATLVFDVELLGTQ
jgi:peptidylprolyl isomerase